MNELLSRFRALKPLHQNAIALALSVTLVMGFSCFCCLPLTVMGNRAQQENKQKAAIAKQEEEARQEEEAARKKKENTIALTEVVRFVEKSKARGDRMQPLIAAGLASQNQARGAYFLKVQKEMNEKLKKFKEAVTPRAEYYHPAEPIRELMNGIHNDLETMEYILGIE